jgi:hypothetical protein
LKNSKTYIYTYCKRTPLSFYFNLYRENPISSQYSDTPVAARTFKMSRRESKHDKREIRIATRPSAAEFRKPNSENLGTHLFQTKSSPLRPTLIRCRFSCNNIFFFRDSVTRALYTNHASPKNRNSTAAIMPMILPVVSEVPCAF